MSSGVTDHDRVVSLRSLAHPVRLQMLSLLTGTPMSAAEVARELGLTHANASYHLRQLLAAGQLVQAGEETIRGGRAKRYRYDVDAPGARAESVSDRTLFARALADELVRRATWLDPAVKGASTDAELWLEPDAWAAAVAEVSEVSERLHRDARPPRTEGAVHVSLTLAMFAMTEASAAGARS
jgi:DNA-binding transcriptional ArsR family regulator